MSKLCSLRYAVGQVEACPERVCPFWEEGGAVLDGGCMLERLLPPADWTPGLAARWLSLRAAIEQARSRAEADEGRRLFYGGGAGERVTYSELIRTVETTRSDREGRLRAGEATDRRHAEEWAPLRARSRARQPERPE